jgi:HAD superfamily hydrolase (TIGR01509 family)
MNSNICVIFDLDGTLVDSEGLCNRAFLDLLPQLRETVDSLTQRNRGKRLATVLADIESRLGQELPDSFEQHYRQRVSELFSSDLKPVPGVPDMLKATHFPKCIASSGPLSKIRKALQASGLADYFTDNIFSSYDVGSWKPEPGIFLHAARTMGFMPRQCVVVEDSDAGIEAAIAAGMTAFRYAQIGASASRQDAVLFNDMSELPRLLAQFAATA